MSWRDLERELGRWRDAGQGADFWWRDDDAAALSTPLARLLELSEQSGVPLALAVVPLEAAPELFDGMRVSVLMHGTDHRNRARPGEKKTEFAADEAEHEAIERLSAAAVLRPRLAEAHSNLAKAFEGAGFARPMAHTRNGMAACRIRRRRDGCRIRPLLRAWRDENPHSGS